MIQTRNQSAISETKSNNAKNKHHDTPKKARIRARFDELDTAIEYGYHPP
jgi:hypothetical protein